MRAAKMSIYTHLSVLQKFTYRLTADIPDETRARLNLLIAIYTRLYV